MTENHAIDRYKHKRHKRSARELLTMADFTPDDRAAIAAARTPSEATAFDDEMDA